MTKLTMMKIEPSIEKDFIPSVRLSKIEIDTDNFLEDCYKEINCDLIEYATFGDPYEQDHFNAIVDEEGLLKSGNLIMELELTLIKEKLKLQLCGTVLLGKSKLDEEHGLIDIGLTDNEIDYLKNNLEVSLIGKTK